MEAGEGMILTRVILFPEIYLKMAQISFSQKLDTIFKR